MFKRKKKRMEMMAELRTRSAERGQKPINDLNQVDFDLIFKHLHHLNGALFLEEELI